METANRRLTAQDMSSLPGYAKGGAIRRMAGGGNVKGHGTGTSDDVPIMASNGEFVIKAKAVKKIGVEALEALNSIADKPDEKDSKAEALREYGDVEGPDEDKAEGGKKGEAKEAFKRGGAIRKMASGGLITEEDKQRAANQSAAYVVGAQANAASNAARVAETQDAGGGGANFAPMPAINSKSGITAQPPVLAPTPTPVAEPSQYRKEMGELGGFLAGAPVEAFKTIVSAPGYGFNAPDKPSMPQPATVPAAGAIPAAVPSPAPQAQQRMTSTFGATDPRRQDVQAPLSAYGATNVGDGVTKMAIPGKTPLYTNMTDAAGMASNEALVGRGAITAQNQGAAEALASRYGVDPALTAARDAAIKRGDIDAVRASYGGNFAGKTAADAPIDALMNNGRPMTTKKAGAIAQLQAQKDGTIQAGATRKLAEDKFALEATGTNLDNQGKKQIQDAQNKVANAKTAAERLSATDTLRALQGKFEKEMPNRFTVVPGGQAVDPMTNQLVREPSQVLDNQTGQFINAAPAKPAQNFTKGQTYTDAKGNKAVWDGQQFVAAK